MYKMYLAILAAMLLPKRNGRTSTAMLPISAAACIRMAAWAATIIRRASPATWIRMAMSVVDSSERWVARLFFQSDIQILRKQNLTIDS